MKAEYDFSKATRGKFIGRFPPDPVYVQFDPEVTALLDGPGDLGDRLRSLAGKRPGGRRSAKPRMVRTLVFSEAEFRVLESVLKRIGGRVTGRGVHPNRRIAPRPRKAG